jgi:hypothetical protein
MAGSVTVGQLNVEVQLQLAKLQGQFDTLQGQVRRNNAQLNSSFKASGDFIRQQFLSIIPAVTLASAVAFEKSLFTGAHNLLHAAEAARVGVEEFQVLAYEARHGGVEIDMLTRAMDKMQLVIEKAARGDKSAERLFHQLGIELKDIRNLAPERQLEAIAVAVQHATNPTEAWAAVVEALGIRYMPRLMEALKRLGTEGFDAVAESARRAGQVMDKGAVEILARKARAMEELWVRVKNRVSETTALIFAKGDVEGLEYQIRYWQRVGNNEDLVKSLEQELAVAIKARTEVQARANAVAEAAARVAQVNISFLSDEERATLKLKAAQDAIDARAAILDPDYDNKVAAAKLRLAEAARKAGLAEMSEAEQIAALRQQSAEWEEKSNAIGLTTLERTADQIEADNLWREAQAKTESQVRALDTANEALAKSTQRVSDREETRIDRLATVRDRTESAQRAYDGLLASLAGAPVDDPDVLEETIKATVTLTQAKTDLAQIATWATGRSDAWIKSFETDEQRYARALHEIAVLEREDFLTVEEAARASAEAWRTLDPVGREVTQTFTQIYSSLSSEGSKAFAEMVLDGRSSFSDLVRIVTEAVLKMAAELAVINPIINAMFNLGGTKSELASWWSLGSLFGGFFAEGGRPPVGRISVVGEGGKPELFIPDMPGTVVPAHALAGAADLGGGDTFIFNYSIPAGVSRAELMPVLRLSQDQTISRIMAMKRAGGGRASSL